MTLLQTVQGDRNPAALLLPATPRAMLDLQQDDAQGYLDGLLLSALLVGGRATVRRVQDGDPILPGSRRGPWRRFAAPQPR